MAFKKVDPKVSFPKLEEEVLKYWEENKVFEKSIESRKGAPKYSFNDGPPFATGLPHYGHIVASVIKDAIPRYWAMRGYQVERKWGWDCHGLPIENIAEKELGIQHKKDIEVLGVAKFNEFCRSKVLEYAAEWEKVMPRIGRWADMKHTYRTMDKEYMESVWWVFKELWDKGLIYESYRSMHVCPRCETTLSQQEVSEGYMDVKDLSVVAKFELVDEPGTYILAWTTTPWTLPGNVALAVGADVEYVKVRTQSKSRKAFLISGKHACASTEYYPKLKNKLEREGYETVIIDHKESANPQLVENIEYLKSFDFSNAHVIVHSLGSSTFLKFLNETDITIASLTMIAPSYPGKPFISTNPGWIEESGYRGFEVDFENIKKKINGSIDIIYSDDEIIRMENIEQLGNALGARMYKEKDKKHFFSKEYCHEPDFKIDFGEYYVCAKDLADKNFAQHQYEIVEEFKGENFVGKSYKPLFDYYTKDTALTNHENGWKVYAADFVTTGDGTGVVHIAPAFGEDDMELGKKEHLPFVQHVNFDGTMKLEVADFARQPVKPKEAPQSMDIEIIKYLAYKGLLFSKEKYEHSYPHCWRCDTPLLNYATSSWFVSVTKIKERMLELAKEIHWSPEHIKEGRFGKWLEGARDWSISRQRYWASIMPIWKCTGQSTDNSQQKTGCGEIKVMGSIAELEQASGKTVSDLHKHVVDEIDFPCEKCGGTMKRIPDVLDTWFDSGSMPYAQEHYPFANQEHFDKSFPADFIAEGVDQTRAWFYYQHVIGTAIKESVAFKNVIVNGIVLADDGKKMSKKLKNYPDPMELVNKHGADALRLYILSSTVVAAENLNFSERDLTEVSRNVFRMLWNSYSFFMTYASIDEWEPKRGAKLSENLLDRWIISELQMLIKNLDQSMEAYELNKATRLFMPFIDNLSNWYIRRSRDRFWKSEDDNDKENAYQTLYDVLVTLAKLMAPFTPFISEEIYRNLTAEESVHLADWPVADEKLIDETLNEEMKQARFIVTIGLKVRADGKVKVRQPLSRVTGQPIAKDLQNMVLDELNVKEYVGHEEMKELVELDLTLTDDLRLEGEMNEINRAIQDGRKKAGFNVEDRIVLGYQGKEKVFEKFGAEIGKKVLATEVENGDLADAEYRETVSIEGKEFIFSLKRV